MIEGNIIKFGYGTTIIEANDWLRVLKFKYAQTPFDVGRSISDDEDSKLDIIEEILFKYDVDMTVLFDQLTQLELYNYKLNFRGYTLDFTNYNPESIRVLSEGLKRVVRGWIMMLAA